MGGPGQSGSLSTVREVPGKISGSKQICLLNWSFGAAAQQGGVHGSPSSKTLDFQLSFYATGDSFYTKFDADLICDRLK